MRQAMLAVTALTLALAACNRQPPQPPPGPAQNVAAWCKPSATAQGPAPARLADWARGAQLFAGLGGYHYKVSTASAEAQSYFDQGLRLVYGFNHDEATRSFVRAAQADPDCAMCWWGAALTLGPNYNIPMLPDRAQAAWDALQNAQRAASKASAEEQALIAALGKRYVGPQPLDPPAMQPHQVEFARAMREVAKQYPDDLDVQTLFAEAMMTSNPWMLWSLDGKPAEGTTEIVATLEHVLEKNPKHPGANHYYVHAVEASQHPEKAGASADLLRAMMPAAGHLVHMPAHIYQRIGRYDDAALANRKGAQADLEYMGKTRPLGYYPMYLAHNYDFLAFSAAMQGRGAEAIDAERKANAAAPAAIIDQMPGMDFFVSKLYFAQLRFGHWDEVLHEPAPPARRAVQTALFHYARGYALAATGKADAARSERALLEKARAGAPADLTAGYSSAKDLFALALDVLDARIATAEKHPDEALRLYRSAVAREDKLNYDEPADWFFPTRHLLGAALLAAGKAPDAEAVYRADLARHPDNGWALYGLAQALKQQQHDTEAAVVEQRYKQAWAQADVQLRASAL